MKLFAVVVVAVVLSVFVLGGRGASQLPVCVLLLRGMEASQLPGV